MKKVFVLLVSVIIWSFPVIAQQALVAGDKAPVFKAVSDNGSTWDINTYLGKKYIVVYFFPAAMTGGCTKQACSYRDHNEELKSADIELVGISGDNIEGLKLFKQAENLNFTLLSDSRGEIAKAFGVPLSGGGSIIRTVEGTEHEFVRGVTAKRWTFIVGKDKKIIYKNESVDPEKDSEDVINFIKLQASK